MCTDTTATAARNRIEVNGLSFRPDEGSMKVYFFDTSPEGENNILLGSRLGRFLKMK
jgi:hypothetical protein